MSYNVTFEFPTKEMAEQFMGYFDGQGEQDYETFMEGYDINRKDLYFIYDYTACVITARVLTKKESNHAE